MIEDQFVTFQRFNDKVVALALGDMLKKHHIEYVLEDASAYFDVSFANNEIDKDFRIKLNHRVLIVQINYFKKLQRKI